MRSFLVGGFYFDELCRFRLVGLRQGRISEEPQVVQVVLVVGKADDDHRPRRGVLVVHGAWDPQHSGEILRARIRLHQSDPPGLDEPDVVQSLWAFYFEWLREKPVGVVTAARVDHQRGWHGQVFLNVPQGVFLALEVLGVELGV